MIYSEEVTQIPIKASSVEQKIMEMAAQVTAFGSLPESGFKPVLLGVIQYPSN